MDKSIGMAVALSRGPNACFYEDIHISNNKPVDLEEYLMKLKDIPQKHAYTVTRIDSSLDTEFIIRLRKISKNMRLNKKKQQRETDLEVFSVWLADLRYFLIEAYDGSEDLRVIREQFKDRMKTSGKRNSFFKVTRMEQYYREAKGGIR